MARVGPGEAVHRQIAQLLAGEPPAGTVIHQVDIHRAGIAQIIAVADLEPTVPNISVFAGRYYGIVPGARSRHIAPQAGVGGIAV